MRQTRPIPRMPGTVSSAAKPRAISVHAAPQLLGVRVLEPRPLCAGEHPAVEADQRDPLGPAARPAKWFGRLLASAQVGDGSARRRVELLLQDIHAKNGEEPLARKSPLGNVPMSHEVSGRLRRCPGRRIPPPAACLNVPVFSEAPPRFGCQRTVGTPGPCGSRMFRSPPGRAVANKPKRRTGVSTLPEALRIPP